MILLARQRLGRGLSGNLLGERREYRPHSPCAQNVSCLLFELLAAPQLNGQVERSHRSNQEELYQLIKYRVDADLEANLSERERFYNFARPHGAFKSKTPKLSQRIRRWTLSLVMTCVSELAT